MRTFKKFVEAMGAQSPTPEQPRRLGVLQTPAIQRELKRQITATETGNILNPEDPTLLNKVDQIMQSDPEVIELAQKGDSTGALSKAVSKIVTQSDLSVMAGGTRLSPQTGQQQIGQYGKHKLNINPATGDIQYETDSVAGQAKVTSLNSCPGS